MLTKYNMVCSNIYSSVLLAIIYAAVGVVYAAVTVA